MALGTAAIYVVFLLVARRRRIRGG